MQYTSAQRVSDTYTAAIYRLDGGHGCSSCEHKPCSYIVVDKTIAKKFSVWDNEAVGVLEGEGKN